MDSEYETVNESPDTETRSSKSWKPFLRQLHIGSSVWTLLFMLGLSTGAPTVIVPQIRRLNTTLVDDELASWLYSTSNLSAIPWVFILPTFTHIIGRKVPYLATCICMSIVNIILFFSTTPYHIIIAQALQGFANASNVSLIFHIIPEYCSPGYRHVFFNIQSTSFFWGMWVSNAIGTYFEWKYISVAGLVCSVYSLTVLFYPESPIWLASKGRIKECELSYRWIRGSSLDAEMELHELVKNQNEHTTLKKRKLTLNWLVETVRCRPFYFPLFLCILVTVQYNFSGKFVCSIYAIDIIKKITGNEQAAYTGMLILDGVTVFGMYVGSFLSKMYKLRTLYLRLSFVSVAFMFILSLYLYLVNLGIIDENNFASLSLLIAYSLSLSSGPIFLSMTIYSELIPVRFQAVSYMITSFIFLFLCTGMLKFSPIIFRDLGVHGSFLFYGISFGICTVMLYRYLPETNNKTLLEIEALFQDVEKVPEMEALKSKNAERS